MNVVPTLKNNTKARLTVLRFHFALSRLKQRVFPCRQQYKYPPKGSTAIVIQIHLLNIPLRVSVASKLATALQLSSPPLMCVFNSESALEMRSDHEQRLSCLMYWAFNEEPLLDIGYNGLNLYTNNVGSTDKPFILLQLSWWRNALLHHWPLLHSGTDCVLCTLSVTSRWASFISLECFLNEQKNCTYPKSYVACEWVSLMSENIATTLDEAFC